MNDDPPAFRRFKRKELLHALITAAAIGIVMNFRNWYVQVEIPLDEFLASYLIVFLTALAVLLLRVAAQKWVAYQAGYHATYTLHKWWLPLGFFLTVFIYGAVPLVAPGAIHVQESKRLRLGAHRYLLNLKHLAMIGLAAPATCVLLMAFLKPFALAAPGPGLDLVIKTVAAIAFFGILLPFSDTEAFHILYYRRGLWFFSVAFVAAYFGLILIAGVFSYVVATAFGLFLLWIYRNHLDA
ncbi:hypothetical protein JXA12_02780 [Candidatus Woesearchaeota archaeon]|nr:hypothetical protein [Candidatus Woesearchaeota archaeon]